jgi:hypothetical protein
MTGLHAGPGSMSVGAAITAPVSATGMAIQSQGGRARMVGCADSLGLVSCKPTSGQLVRGLACPAGNTPEPPQL